MASSLAYLCECEVSFATEIILERLIAKLGPRDLDVEVFPRGGVGGTCLRR